MSDLLERPFACMDCGRRASTPGTCGRCSEPMLDLRLQSVQLACLDDDERRRYARERKLLVVAVPAAMLSVAALKLVLGDYGALLPLFGSIWGFVTWGTLIAYLLWRGLVRAFPAEKRFPYLSSAEAARGDVQGRYRDP